MGVDSRFIKGHEGFGRSGDISERSERGTAAELSPKTDQLNNRWFRAEHIQAYSLKTDYNLCGDAVEMDLRGHC